jgi:primosomal protein N'
MYVKVVPYINLPQDIKIQEFTYEIPDSISSDIKIGTIVFVLFRNRKVEGYISHIYKKTPKLDKKINNIISVYNKYSITNLQVEIINFISENFFVNKSKAFKTVIPKLPRR